MDLEEESHPEMADAPYNTVELPPTIDIKESSVRKGEAGAFSKILIKKDTRFGPYKGEIISAGQKDYIDYRYAWEVFEKNSDELKYTISAINPRTSNWMRNVNCARFYEEQNILSIQEGYSIFYVAMKDIEAGEELLTWFDPKLLKRTQRRLSKMERKPIGYTIELVPWSETKHFVPKIIETKRARKKKVMSDMICLDEDPLAITRTLQKFPKIPWTQKQLSQSSRSEMWGQSEISGISSSVAVPKSVLDQPANLPPINLPPVKKKRGRKPKIRDPCGASTTTVGHVNILKEGISNASSVSRNDPTNSGSQDLSKASASINSDKNIPSPTKVKKKRGRKKGVGLLRNGPVKLGRPKLRRTSGGEIAPDDLATVKPVVIKTQEDGSTTVEDHDETYSLRNVELRQECDEKCPCLDKKEAMKTHQDIQDVFVIHFTLLPEHKSETPEKKIIYRCDICDSAYNHAFSLKRHYLSVHINHRYLSRDDILSCQIETFHTGVELRKGEVDLDKSIGSSHPYESVTSPTKNETTTSLGENISTHGTALEGPLNKVEDNLLCHETLADWEGEKKKLNLQEGESGRKLMSVQSLITLAQSSVDSLNMRKTSVSEKTLSSGEQSTKDRETETKLNLQCDESLDEDLLQPEESEIQTYSERKSECLPFTIESVSESTRNSSIMSSTKIDVSGDVDKEEMTVSIDSNQELVRQVMLSGDTQQNTSLLGSCNVLDHKSGKDAEPKQSHPPDTEKKVLSESIDIEKDFNSTLMTLPVTDSCDNNAGEENKAKEALSISTTVDDNKPLPDASDFDKGVEDDSKFQIPSAQSVESNPGNQLSDMKTDQTCVDIAMGNESAQQISETACSDVEMTETNSFNSSSIVCSALTEQQECLSERTKDKKMSGDVNMNSEPNTCAPDEPPSSVSISNEIKQSQELQDTSKKPETGENIKSEPDTSTSQAVASLEKNRAANPAQQQVIFVTNIVFPILSPSHKQPTTTVSSLPSSSSAQGSTAVTSSGSVIQSPLTSQSSGVPLVLISQIPHGLNVQNAATALLQSSTALKTLQTIQSSLNVMNLGNTATRLSSSNLSSLSKSPTSVVPGICFSSPPRLVTPGGPNTLQTATSSTSSLILTKSTLPLVSPIALPSLQSSHIILSPPSSKSGTIPDNGNDSSSKISTLSHVEASNTYSLSSKIPKSVCGQPDDLYRCHMCVLVFKTMSQLKHHIKNDPHRFKGGIKQYACMQCSMRFSNKNNLLRHNQMNHNENEDYKFRCFTCGKGFISETYLKMHARFHSGKNFPCKYGCKDTYFPNAASLVKHLRTQHAGLNLKEYLKNAKAEKARRKKLNRIFGVSDEQITSLGIDGSVKEGLKITPPPPVPYSMTQPGIGFQAKRGRPKGSKNHVKRVKQDFIATDREKPQERPVSELAEPNENAEGLIKKQLKIRFRCKQCQEGFTTHLKLLQHRRLRHGASESVQEYLYEMSKDIHEEGSSDSDLILRDVSPPPSPKTFFANVNRKGLENMTNYIDCNSESLKSWRKHIKFDDYDSISERIPHLPKSRPNLEFTMFNFSPSFQYKEDCTMFYDGTQAGQSAYSDGLVEQKRNKNAIRDEVDSSCLSDNENMVADASFAKTDVSETCSVHLDSDPLGREIDKEEKTGLPEEKLKFETLNSCGLKSQERGNSIISRLEQHLRGSLDQGQQGVKKETDVSNDVSTSDNSTNSHTLCDTDGKNREATDRGDKSSNPEACIKLEGEDLDGMMDGERCVDSSARDEKTFDPQLMMVEDVTLDNSKEEERNMSGGQLETGGKTVTEATTAFGSHLTPTTLFGERREEIIPNTTDSGFNSLSSISSGSMDFSETISRNFQDCLANTALGKDNTLVDRVTTHHETDVATPMQILTNNDLKDGEKLLPPLPVKQKLEVLKSPYIQGINLEANLQDFPVSTQSRKVAHLSDTTYSPQFSFLNALDLHSTGESVSCKKLCDMLEKSNSRFSTPIKGHRHRTISLPSLGFLSPSKRSQRLFNHSLEASLNVSDNSRHDHRRYSIWGGHMHHKVNKRKGEKMFCCPVVEAVKKQEFIREKEKYEYEKSLRDKEIERKQSKFYREKVNFAQMMGLTSVKEYEQSHIAKKQQEHSIKPPEIWDNYENIWFGKRGTITVVCSICHRHFSGIDLCWRHQLKKHPHIEPSSLEMERDNDVEDLYYYYPMRYGILAQTQLIPDNLPPPEVYACTRCGFPFKNINKLHAHIIACDPSQEEISLSREGKQHKPSYMKKKLLPMMDRRLNQEPDLPPPKPKVGRPHGSSTVSKMAFAAGGKTASTSGPRKRDNIKTLARASEHRPTTSVFQNRAGFSSPYSFFNGRRRKNYELLYNPQNHTRRRELYQVLDQHQCHGCNLKFKSLSLLERHVKKCVGRDKLQSQKPLLSGILPDDAAMRKQHTCRYCNKRFTYIKGVDLHYKRICAVRKVKEEENQLTEEDFLHEAELKRIIEHMKWSKSFNKDSSDIIQGNVKVEEDGTLTRVVKKRGWPRGLKKKVKKKGFKWTTLKRHRPEDEMPGHSPPYASPQSSPEASVEDTQVNSDALSENKEKLSATPFDRKRVTRSSSLDDIQKDSGNRGETVSPPSSSTTTCKAEVKTTSSSSEKKPGKRGRPRKYDLDGNLIAKAGRRPAGRKAVTKESTAASAPQTKTPGAAAPTDSDTIAKPPARKRGRPKKFDPSDVESSSKKKNLGDSTLDSLDTGTVADIRQNNPVAMTNEDLNNKAGAPRQSLAQSRQPRNKTQTPLFNDDYVYESPSARKKKSAGGSGDKNSTKSSKIIRPEATNEMIEKMKQLKEAALSEMTKDKQTKRTEPKKAGSVPNTVKSQNAPDGKDEEKTNKSPQRVGLPSTTELFKHLTKDPSRSANVKNTEVPSITSRKSKGQVISKSKESEPVSSTVSQSSTSSAPKRKRSTESPSVPPGKHAKTTIHSPAPRTKTIVTIKSSVSAGSTDNTKSAKKSDVDQKIEKIPVGSKSGAPSVSRIATTTLSVKTTNSTISSNSSSSPSTKNSTSPVTGPVQKPAKVSVRVVTLSPNGTNLLTYDSPSDVPSTLSSSLKTSATVMESPNQKILSTVSKGGVQLMGKVPVQVAVQENPLANQAILSAKNSSSNAGQAFQGRVVQAPTTPESTTAGIIIQKPSGEVLYKYADGHIVQKTDADSQLEGHESTEIVYKYADGHVHLPTSDTSFVEQEPDNEDVIYVFEDEHGDQHYIEEDQLEDPSFITQKHLGQTESTWSEVQPTQTSVVSTSSQGSLPGQITVLCTSGQMQRSLPTPVIQSLSEMGQMPSSDNFQPLSAKDHTHIQIKGGIITPKLEEDLCLVSGESAHLSPPTKSVTAPHITLPVPAPVPGVCLSNPSSHVGKPGTLPAVVVSSPPARVPNINKTSLTGIVPVQRLTSPPSKLVPQSKLVTMTGTVIPNILQGGVIQSGPRMLKLGSVIGTSPSLVAARPPTVTNTSQGMRPIKAPSIIPTVVTSKPVLLNPSHLPRVVSHGTHVHRPQQFIKTVPVTGSHIISVGSRQTMSSSTGPPVIVQHSRSNLQHLNIQQHKIITLPQPSNSNNPENSNAVKIASSAKQPPAVSPLQSPLQTNQIMFSLEDGTTAMLDPDSLAQFLSVSPALSKTEFDSVSPDPGVDITPENTMVNMTEIQPDQEESQDIIWESGDNLDFMEISDSSCQL